MTTKTPLFCIRTVTAFCSLDDSDFDDTDNAATKIQTAIAAAKDLQQSLIEHGYLVQTIRLATNPFPDWHLDKQRLQWLDQLLEQHQIDFCALGCATQESELPMCVKAIALSHRFSISLQLSASDVALARAAAQCVKQISQLTGTSFVDDGLGNFRFCVSSCKPYIPFFPAAKAQTGDPIGLAIGLENGVLAHSLLQQTKSISHMNLFRHGMTQALLPVQVIGQRVAKIRGVKYRGMDTSLNPSLDDGSVAAAMEQMEEVTQFGGPGTLAVAAAITRALQNLEGIQPTGYCGLMLPLCEDRRLAELANQNKVQILDLLNISNVCGVGVDTVPIPGEGSVDALTSLLLDVVGLAERWDKSLSCRVFPVPGKTAGEMTTFDSPYMVNARILQLES